MEQYAFRYAPAYGTHQFRNFPGSKQYDMSHLAKWSENGPKGTYAMGKLIKTDVQKVLNPGPILRQNAYSTRAYKTPKPSTLELEDAQRLPRGGMVMRVLASSSTDEGGIMTNPHPAERIDQEMQDVEQLLDYKANQYSSFIYQTPRVPTPAESSTGSLKSLKSTSDNAMSIDRISGNMDVDYAEGDPIDELTMQFGGYGGGLDLRTELMEIDQKPKTRAKSQGLTGIPVGSTMGTSMVSGLTNINVQNDREKRMRDTFSVTSGISAESLNNRKKKLNKVDIEQERENRRALEEENDNSLLGQIKKKATKVRFASGSRRGSMSTSDEWS